MEPHPRGLNRLCKVRGTAKGLLEYVRATGMHKSMARQWRDLVKQSRLKLSLRGLVPQSGPQVRLLIIIIKVDNRYRVRQLQCSKTLSWVLTSSGLRIGHHFNNNNNNKVIVILIMHVHHLTSCLARKGLCMSILVFVSCVDPLCLYVSPKFCDVRTKSSANIRHATFILHIWKGMWSSHFWKSCMGERALLPHSRITDLGSSLECNFTFVKTARTDWHLISNLHSGAKASTNSSNVWEPKVLTLLWSRHHWN